MPNWAAQGRERSLLVEDEPVVRNLVHRMLGRAGTTWRGRGRRRGLEQARGLAAPIHLLTDVVMITSGRELADRIRDPSETRVLYTSGYTDTAIIGEDELGDRTQFLRSRSG
jgi:CheY-like chemotaxis protein